MSRTQWLVFGAVLVAGLAFWFFQPDPAAAVGGGGGAQDTSAFKRRQAVAGAAGAELAVSSSPFGVSLNRSFEGLFA